MTDYEFLEVTTDGRTRRITLDNPEAMNALNATLRSELEAALLDAEDDDLRAVVLAGRGEAFSAGYDFSEDHPESMDGRLRASYDHLDAVWSLDLPVVAAVDGYALAGGCNLALACDLTFATERSEFGYPDVHMGELPPRLVVPFVADSLKHARELLYTGKHVDAREAARMGLVNRVFDDGTALEAAVEAELERIRKTPGAVVTLLKDTLNDVQETQGYRSGSAGAVDEYLFAATAGTEAAGRFHDIVEEEGVSAAIEWMHTTEKE